MLIEPMVTTLPRRWTARAIRLACAGCLLAGTIFLGAQNPAPRAASPAPAPHTPAPRGSLRGVPNFGQVTPTLYRGAQPNQEGFANLARAGVNIVVDLRGSAGEQRIVTALGMRYVAIPWQCYRPHDEPIAQFLLLLRQNPGKKVFVHCRQGDDRTGMEIAAYRMVEQGWTAEEAGREMEFYGANWLHRIVCRGLAAYEEAFPARFRSEPAFKDLRLGPPAPPPEP